MHFAVGTIAIAQHPPLGDISLSLCEPSGVMWSVCRSVRACTSFVASLTMAKTNLSGKTQYLW